MTVLAHAHGGDLDAIQRTYGIPKEEIIDFSGNINPLGFPKRAEDALKENLHLICTYPDKKYKALKQAIGTYTGADPSHIVVGNGSTELISTFIQTVHAKHSIIMGPAYSEYEREVSLGGGKFEYFPLKEEEDFKLNLPALLEALTPDVGMFVACNPNNPTGTTLTRDQLKVWVDYANRAGAVILYDAAYEAYISEEDVPHSIFEIEGARTCAIEFRSFSKKAGFTGVRLGFTVVPKDLKWGDVMLHSLWARRHGTKFNGAPYIEQRAGEAVYSEEGSRQVMEQVAYYKRNAMVIYEGLKEAGYTVFGGINSPYIWLKVEDGMDSWEFFDYLLEQANVVGTPGSGFGPSGEGYFRLTAFGTYENTVEAVKRIKALRR